jgi:uncharacterized protein YqhQ
MSEHRKSPRRIGGFFCSAAETAHAPKFNYGGQAVIEGVMIRGRTHVTVAVRRPNGMLKNLAEPLPKLFTGAWRKIPFLRGAIVLAETLSLGLKAIMFSAEAALEEEDAKEEVKLSGFASAAMLTVSLALAIGIFFIIPLLISRAFDSLIENDIAANIFEGVIRFAIFIGYIWLMGRMKDMKRLFMYHAAEHMTIACHEHGEPLETRNIRKYKKEHPRCGTAFLLTVMVVAIILFAFLGRPDLWLLIVSRIVLIPVIAAISYEIIRFNAAHLDSLIGRVLTYPGLMMQKLTTYKPDDQQIEVAVAAMNAAIAADAKTP